MLTREPTEQMIAEWKRVFKENRGKLSPGLDERDLENYFLVSEYIRLKKK